MAKKIKGATYEDYDAESFEAEDEGKKILTKYIDSLLEKEIKYLKKEYPDENPEKDGDIKHYRKLIKLINAGEYRKASNLARNADTVVRDRYLDYTLINMLGDLDKLEKGQLNAESFEAPRGHKFTPFKDSQSGERMNMRINSHDMKKFDNLKPYPNTIIVKNLKDGKRYKIRKPQEGKGADIVKQLDAESFEAEMMGSVGDIENHSVDKYKTQHFLTDKELSDFLIKHGTNHDSIRKNKKAKGNIIISTPEGGWISEAKFSLSNPDNENDKDMLMIIPDDYLGIHQDAESFEADDDYVIVDRGNYRVRVHKKNLDRFNRSTMHKIHSDKNKEGLMYDEETSRWIPLEAESFEAEYTLNQMAEKSFKEIDKISGFVADRLNHTQESWSKLPITKRKKILRKIRKDEDVWFDLYSLDAESFEAEKINTFSEIENKWKDSSVTIYDEDADEFYGVKEILVQEGDDVLEDGHPYLVLNKDSGDLDSQVFYRDFQTGYDAESFE